MTQDQKQYITKIWELLKEGKERGDAGALKYAEKALEALLQPTLKGEQPLRIDSVELYTKMLRGEAVADGYTAPEKLPEFSDTDEA